MTKCFIEGAVVRNVGEWDYGKEKKVIEQGEYTVLADGTFGYETIERIVYENPLPATYVEADVPLAWTADGRIVLATDPAAEVPYD